MYRNIILFIEIFYAVLSGTVFSSHDDNLEMPILIGTEISLDAHPEENVICSAINNSSHIAGYIYGRDNPKIFLWESMSNVTVIDAPKNTKCIDVSDINDKDKIVGSLIDENDNEFAYLWSKENKGLHIFRGSDNCNTKAFAINNNDIIVGDLVSEHGVKHAVCWDENLDFTMLSQAQSNTVGINQNNVIVGSYLSEDGSHKPCYWCQNNGQWMIQGIDKECIVYGIGNENILLGVDTLPVRGKAVASGAISEIVRQIIREVLIYSFDCNLKQNIDSEVYFDRNSQVLFKRKLPILEVRTTDTFDKGYVNSINKNGEQVFYIWDKQMGLHSLKDVLHFDNPFDRIIITDINRFGMMTGFVLQKEKEVGVIIKLRKNRGKLGTVTY